MRKMMLFTAFADVKLGCARLQAPASGRPETVKIVSTPPFGELTFTEPFLLKKNGKRASTVGPVGVMKYGVLSLGATPFVVNCACGFDAGPDPPIAGCAWHETQLLELNRGPSPLLETVSN